MISSRQLDFPFAGTYCLQGRRILFANLYICIYTLFVGIYSVIYNMTGYSHSCYSVKLIHWGGPERDVFRCCESGLIVFYFILCQSSLPSTVIRSVYKDKWL